MKLARLALRLLVAVFFAVDSSHAASLSEAIDAARAQVRDNIAPKTPGVSIAVAHDGIILWSERFGFADLAAQKPVTTTTQFRIGSVAKPLTAAGLMLLVEEGKIDLDSDIHRYVPDYPDKGAVITTRQLAGHLSGIRHYRGREFYSDVHYDSVWSHSGGAVGGTSDLVIYPDTGIVIVIACNFADPAGASTPFDKRSLQLITDDFTALFRH